MRVWVTPHAAARYVERVKPCMELRFASWELGRLCGSARRVAMPAWAGEHEADWWLELADGIVAVVRRGGEGKLPWVATVLIRGGSRPEVRAWKNKRRAERAHARRLRAKREGGRPLRSGDFGSDDYA